MKAKVFALLFVLVLLCPTVLSAAAEAKTLISVQNFGLRYDFVSDGTVRIWTSATSSYELWFTLGGQSL